MTKVLSMPEVYGPQKPFETSRMERSTPLTLPTCGHFTPKFVTPINVVAREHVVKRILKHDFTDPNKKLWLVQVAAGGR